MDIIVTTPKSQMANAAQEAADVIADGGGEYFRRFPHSQAPKVKPGDRVYYVENGWITGYAVVTRTDDPRHTGVTCDTTMRTWPPGFYVFMDATTWRWIRPIPMKGFQGFRYTGLERTPILPEGVYLAGIDRGDGLIDEVFDEGDWLAERPRSCRKCGCTDQHGCYDPGQDEPEDQVCHWVADDLCSACD
jgi:hypothetical protein